MKSEEITLTAVYMYAISEGNLKMIQGSNWHLHVLSLVSDRSRPSMFPSLGERQ